MGEVYRARDLTLGRDVAIKVLPAAFAADPDRVARFAREARLLAALSHPHIGSIYGLEQADGVPALVLELVEGPTLADRLSAGPVPVAEVTAIALQLAGAIEAAHEKGIIHRDLKPANIKLSAHGAVKVLDFGLAKALRDELDATDGVTVTSSGTHAGTVLGTAAYMSPEQARGLPVDTRTDIWAFGSILYELLTGRAPFAAETVSDTVSAILTREPDWQALPGDTPDHLRRLVRRCLEKDAKRRLRDIGDARIELESAGAPELTPPALRPGSRRTMAAIAAVLIAVAALAAWGWLRPLEPAPRESMRVTVRLAPGTTVVRGPQFVSSVALSPDGRLLVIAGKDASGQRLYRRSLDALEPTPLAGTEGGSSPFFSPDGRWIGFFAADRLKRVPVEGGASLDITTAAAPQIPRGAAWLPDDRIVFGSGTFTPLQIVAAAGGASVPLAPLDAAAGETSHFDPYILPDGRTLLVVVSRQGDNWIDALDLPTSERTRIVEGFSPRYVPTGHLVFSRGPNILAAAWDPSRREIGPVIPLADGVATEATRTRHFAISPAGTLAYVAAPRTHALVMSAGGTDRRLGEESASLENPRFSPGGDRVVVAARRRIGEATDLWTYDVRTGTSSRLTFDGARAPLWNPGGRAVTYSHLGDQPGIYTKAAEGGAARRLVPLEAFHWLIGWTPDGNTLAYGRMEASTADGRSLSSITQVTDDTSRTVVEPGSVWGGRLSPDGRWLVYYTLAPSGFEVYVTPFPAGGTRWLIAEGTDPSWAPNGDIYYRSGDRLMAARVDAGTGVRALSHRVAAEPFSPPGYDDYDVAADGTLVLVQPVGDAVGREVTLVLDWFTEVRRLTASSRR